MPGELIDRTGLRDGPDGRYWLLDTKPRMLHRRDCDMTIDRKHPAALSLIHKAPDLIIFDYQSATIEA